MLRTFFMTKNEGEDPFTKHESEPADYMNDEAFKDEDVEADREDILGDLDHDQDQDNYGLEDNDDDYHDEGLGDNSQTEGGPRDDDDDEESKGDGKDQSEDESQQ